MFTYGASDVTVTSQQHAAAAAAAAAMLASYTWRVPSVESSLASSPYARRSDECWLSMRRSASAAAAAAAGRHSSSSPSSSTDFTTHSFNVSSSGGDAVTPPAVRSKSLGRESTTTLKTWLLEHIKNPYPSKGEKIMLAVMTRMTLTQVSTWFANARRRLKKEYRVRWLNDSDSDDDDDDHIADDDDENDDDKGDGDVSQQQQQPARHLSTSRHQSAHSEREPGVTVPGVADHDDLSLPSSSAAVTDDDCRQTSVVCRDDQPVNMSCRRLIAPAVEHADSQRSAAASTTRIWSVVELIQSKNTDD